MTKERSQYSKGFGAGFMTMGAIGGPIMLVVTGLTSDIRESDVRLQTTPVAVELQDVNHDGLKDIVIETEDKTTYIYLQQKDGTYKLQSQVEKEWRDEINRLGKLEKSL